MSILGALIPVSLILGGIGLAAFVWCIRTRQFDDLEGDQHRGGRKAPMLSWARPAMPRW